MTNGILVVIFPLFVNLLVPYDWDRIDDRICSTSGCRFSGSRTIGYCYHSSASWFIVWKFQEDPFHLARCTPCTGLWRIGFVDCILIETFATCSNKYNLSTLPWQLSRRENETRLLYCFVWLGSLSSLSSSCYYVMLEGDEKTTHPGTMLKHAKRIPLTWFCRLYTFWNICRMFQKV